MDLTFTLHPAQTAVYRSKARFKVLVCGRRWGKSTYAVMSCILEGLKDVNERGVHLDSSSEVAYFGVDREQARRNVWSMLCELAAPVTAAKHENTCVLTLINGVRIRLLGMDTPDSARGMKLRYAVMDEYATMPPHAFDEIVRPALMDCQGDALFIGTPAGRNHFYELYSAALRGELGPEWESFNFTTGDNPTINRGELKSIATAYSRGSPELYRQEIEGKFVSKGGAIFARDDFRLDPVEPKQGSFFVTVDLAGFTKEEGRKNAQLQRLDESAIAIVKAFPTTVDGRSETGWWVKEIQHGRWDVEETALRIVLAYQKVQATSVGIEKGALARAVYPYMNQIQQSRGLWLNIMPVTHGNQNKWDRIQWALQGRAKQGLITLNPGEWNEPFLEQAVDFPSRLTHDDLIDALSFQDQIAEYASFADFEQKQVWKPADLISGY